MDKTNLKLDEWLIFDEDNLFSFLQIHKKRSFNHKKFSKSRIFIFLNCSPSPNI